MRDDPLLLGIGLMLLLLLALAGLLFSFIQAGRQRQETARLRRELATLKQTVGALCSSSVGVDKRVTRLERHGRDLEERQENIESSQQLGEPPYAEAIRRVQEGADAQTLVDELGLNHGEADLILMMHGIRQDSPSTG